MFAGLAICFFLYNGSVLLSYSFALLETGAIDTDYFRGGVLFCESPAVSVLLFYSVGRGDNSSSPTASNGVSGAILLNEVRKDPIIAPFFLSF